VGPFRSAQWIRATLETHGSDRNPRSRLSGFCAALFRSRTALAAENLFLRKQLALFQEREKKAARTTAPDRLILATLARFFDWRSALVIVKPDTLLGWHRTAFRRSGVGSRGQLGDPKFHPRSGA
jgi:putative transposase